MTYVLNMIHICPIIKNTGATYQRMMTRMFRDKIGSTVEVYINDMVVKSRENQRHVKYLEEMLRYLDSISCASTPTNVPSEWGWGNF